VSRFGSSISEKASEWKMSTFGDAYSLRSLSQLYVSCRITGVPPLQSDFYGLSSALKDDTIEPEKNEKKRAQNQRKWRGKSQRYG